jgi:hypothetical protein
MACGRYWMTILHRRRPLAVSRLSQVRFRKQAHVKHWTSFLKQYGVVEKRGMRLFRDTLTCHFVIVTRRAIEVYLAVFPLRSCAVFSKLPLRYNPTHHILPNSLHNITYS